jgi:bacteriocin-like protein
MKQQKKASTKDGKAKATSKAPTSKRGKELSEDQLEQVSGGAYDTYLKIDGIQGESTAPQQQFKVILKID